MTTAPAPSISKLPAITLAFWIMKICATTLGETLGDFLSKGPDDGGLNLGYAVASIIVLCIFFATLVPQLLATKLHPFLYWAVILSTSTAGTTMSDFMDRTLELGYAIGSLILIGLLVFTLTAWRWTEGSISVGSVRSKRAEIFYWCAILASNTLGTALGDYLADKDQGPGLGFLGSAVLIGSLIAAIAATHLILRRRPRISPTVPVVLFWSAFILTRPFGATFGDALARDYDEGGIGLGAEGASAVLAGILVSVIFISAKRNSRPQPPVNAPL